MEPSRVAPIKILSIIMLELQAALLTSRLRHEIEKLLTIKIENLYMWTDGTTELQCLQPTSQLPVFVLIGFCEFLKFTLIDEWFHVSSGGDYPADIGTRGISAEALNESGWFKGSLFLKIVHSNLAQKLSPEFDSKDSHMIRMNLLKQILLEHRKPLINCFVWKVFRSFTKT